MVTRSPRLLRRRPSDAAVIPLPSELATPPVTKMCLVTGAQTIPRSSLRARMVGAYHRGSLAGSPPAADAAPDKVQDYFLDHQGALKLAVSVSALVLVAAVLFASGAAAALRDRGWANLLLVGVALQGAAIIADNGVTVGLLLGVE